MIKRSGAESRVKAFQREEQFCKRVSPSKAGTQLKRIMASGNRENLKNQREKGHSSEIKKTPWEE